MRRKRKGEAEKESERQGGGLLSQYRLCHSRSPRPWPGAPASLTLGLPRGEGALPSSTLDILLSKSTSNVSCSHLPWLLYVELIFPLGSRGPWSVPLN